MRTERLSFEGRPLFERIATGLLCLGASTGVLLLPLGIGGAPARWPAPLCLVLAAALLAAKTLRGRDDTLPVAWRVGLVGSSAVLAVSFHSAAVLALSLGAFTGLAMAGDRTASGARRAVGLAAGALASAWALLTMPALMRALPDVGEPLQGILVGAAAALLFGVGLLLLHVRVHVDAVAARLARVEGELGGRLQQVWSRCHRALREAPTGQRRQVLRLISADAAEAGRLAGVLATLEVRLQAAARTDAQSQRALILCDAAATSDATTRARLTSAAASLSDTLEALDSLGRRRERLGADVRLKLATLERAAMALETAQGEPAELQSLVLRLSQPALT